MCGDLATTSDKLCYCGPGDNTGLNLKTGDHYCCVPPSPDGTTQVSSYNVLMWPPLLNFKLTFSRKCVNGSLATFGHTVCKTGTPTKMSEVCNGRCFNEYQEDKVLGDRAHFRCQKLSGGVRRTHCVEVKRMCQGYSHCDDRSDVAACREGLKCAGGRGSNSTGRLETELVKGHHYCSYSHYDNDR